SLAGWDRTGWGAAGHVGDHWMRMRDRRATLAMPVLAVAYCALVCWALAFGLHLAAGIAPPGLHPAVRALLWVNAGLLGWRMLVRAGFVRHAHGWSEAVWAPLRMVVANVIALAAARRAAGTYARILAGHVPQWDKTAHHFPDDAEAVA